jgi:hypothetical protein
MSHRPAASSPTITSLLASSTPTKVFLPSLSNLVTSAVTSTSTEQLAAANASSSGNKRKKSTKPKSIYSLQEMLF